MTGTFDAALALLDSLEGEGRFFALRRFQIKRLKRNSGKLLDILTVCSAVPFSERNIQDSATASPGGSEVSGDESPGVRRRERREE